MAAVKNPNNIMLIPEMTGGISTENNVMTSVKVDGVHFNQDELVTSCIAVKEYGAYIPIPGKDLVDVPSVTFNGETYIFGVYTLSASAATTYRKGTITDFTHFLNGASGPVDGGNYAFINTKKITG